MRRPTRSELLAKSDALLAAAIDSGRVPDAILIKPNEAPRSVMYVAAPGRSAASVGMQTAKRARLVDETRQCVAGALGVPARTVPTGWRRMAKLLQDNPGSMRNVARILDDARRARGFPPAIGEWFADRGKA